MSAPFKLQPGEAIYSYDGQFDIRMAEGASVPADTLAGYARGCVFFLTTGNGVGSTVYINEGTELSCDFNPLRNVCLINLMYGEATPLDQVFANPGACRVLAVRNRPLVVGSDGGAVTAMPMKVPSGTATASGTALLTAAFDLKATINTLVTGTLSATAADLILAATDSIGFDCTGTMTAARGCCTVAVALL